MTMCTMAEASLADIPMTSLVEQVLPFRSSKYIEDFCEKLLGEGIAAPADLLRTSKEALETKLSTHANFNFIEMADAVSLRQSLDKKPGGNQRSRSPPRGGQRQQRRGRSRSGGRDGKGDRGRNRSCGKGNRGRRQNSRPHRQEDRGDREMKVKPELWAAIERNEMATAQRLLAQGANPEETFEGWTPLMKASEENCPEIIQMLVEKKVNLEASNRKGRTALSFAAAPSNNEKTRRPTAVEALRLLIQSGADPKSRSVSMRGSSGRTPKDYAESDKREDALAVFAELGL